MALPVITGATPTGGPTTGGTSVTIAGSNFGNTQKAGDKVTIRYADPEKLEALLGFHQPRLLRGELQMQLSQDPLETWHVVFCGPSPRQDEQIIGVSH